MISLYNLDEYQEMISHSKAVLFYFSSPQCSVCKVLEPKVIDLLSEKFPRMKPVWIDIEKSPVIAGQQRIFTTPTILVFFEGKESLRKSRNISIVELEEEIGRSYDLMFKK